MRRQEIVIIGQDLDEATLRAQLDACLIDPLEMRLGPIGWRRSCLDPLPAWETESNEDGELASRSAITPRNAARLDFRGARP